ncbi:hypothetical protein MBLNU459_g1551t1 [Dothideomycetes sp. NU459]
MGNPGAKRRRADDVQGRRKPAKKIRNFKKQKSYHSSSESDDDSQDGADFKPVSMDDSDDDEAIPVSSSAGAAALAPALRSALKHTDTKDSAEEPAQDSDDDAPDNDDDDDDDEQSDDALVERLDDLVDTDEPDLDDDDDEYDSDDSDRSATSATGANATSLKRKRNDPTVFATSMSKILGTKLTSTKRSDPVLSRSAAATAASKEMVDQRLEAKARRQLNVEKRQAMEKGRIRDVLGLDSTDVSTADIQEQERRLKKTAQRGVVKLFNAVRAAQVKGEQAREDAKKEGVVGMAQREERVSEMSKKGFLDLIAGGGKKAPAMNVQEA